ncbi:MAG: hypothetical protein ACP5N7_01040 [Candidatus Pacearchaeota archaeon]
MLTIKCELFRNFTVNEITVAKKGFEILNSCLNSDSFRVLVEKTKFVGTKDTGKIILDKLLSGADSKDPIRDYQMNIKLVMYYRWWSKVVGYVLDDDNTIYINRKYFDSSMDGNIGAVNFSSNILHEYMHLMGYSHKSSTDYGSVPYKMNSLYEQWCRENKII